jgi:hypothetical protein
MSELTNGSSSCNFEFRIIEPYCSMLKHTGTITLPGSNPFFADNDKGGGSVIKLTIGIDSDYELRDGRW